MRRVLIVSADMGAGHNTAGRALETAVREQWPDVEVHWLDTLDVMGRGVGPVFRWIYVVNVQRTPWLYEFFYGSLWRHRWFAHASKTVVGAWCGLRLRRRVAAAAPDLVLSTYPLGTAGLEWLRRRSRLDVPIGAWITDFAPHPFWVYESIDLNLVMHPNAVPLAQRCVPGAEVAVSAPPVDRAFRPGDRDAARAALGLPGEAFVALVSCGSLGFGDVERTTGELLAAHPSVLPVVVCGHNRPLRERIERLAQREPRVRTLGWTDQVPALTVAADVVVTNAGGLTGLEALACGRPLLMYRPIAAHGRANAELMAEAGLAVVCDRDGTLASTVRTLISDPDRLGRMGDAAAADVARTGPLSEHLHRLASRANLTPPRPAGRRQPRRDAARPLRPQDALFAYVESPEVPQQLGAVLVLEPKPDGCPATRTDAAYLLDAAPGGGQRLRRGGAWRRPAWVPQPDLRPSITERPLDAQPDLHTALRTVMDDFFGDAIDAEHNVCEACLVTGIDGGRSALLIKIHHATADGIAVINELVGRALGHPLQETAAALPRRRSVSVAALARGLWVLARAGRAPRTGLPNTVTSESRHHSLVTLPAAPLRAAARQVGCRTTELVLAMVAAALHEELGDRAGEWTRVLVPVSMRTAESYRRLGNQTGAVSVDLPTGAMPLLTRIARTSAALRRQVGSGAPVAGQAVVRAIGLLPAWAHRRLARLTYRGTWFSLIASVLPGPRSPVTLRGALVSIVYPVMPLAPGVGLAVGAMFWGDKLTVCVTVERGNAALGDGLAARIEAGFAQLREELADTAPPELRPA